MTGEPAQANPSERVAHAPTRAWTGLLYAGIVLGAAWAMVIALDHGVSAFWAGAGIQTVVIAIVIALEYALPYRRSWLASHGDVVTDLAHFIITSNVATWIRLGLTLGFFALVGSHAGPGWWPTSWPLALQVVLAIAIQNFVGYWVHRAQHAVPVLWRLHAVHHSSPRVYWLNQTRAHPLESILDGLSSLSLLALGVPEQTMLVFTAFTGAHLLLQHANIDLRLGPFNWLVSMSEAHRWHHSRTRSEADANFGGVLMIWDVVFRTCQIPRDRQAPADPGIADRPDFPTGYLGQLASPFRRSLWR